MEGKNKQLTPNQLQKQATEKYWKEKGPEMIIDPDRLSEAQRVAEEERIKATEPVVKK